MVAVHMIAHGHIWYADDDSSLNDLLDAVFVASQEQGWAVSMVALPNKGPGTWMTHMPSNRLRVAIDPSSTWAALNFLQLNLDDRTYHSCITVNYPTDLDAPKLPFGRGDLMFPATAAISTMSARKAVAEYSHTACRPCEVFWQLSNYV